MSLTGLVKRSKSLISSNKIRLSIISLLALSLIGGATVYALTTRNSHNRGVVMFVGDSNIVMGSASIVWNTNWNSHHDNGYTPLFAARVGAGIRTPDCLDTTNCTTTDFWATKLGETFPKVQPDAVVVNLGINDTTEPGTATSLGYANYDQKIDWFMNLVPAGTKVLWSNLPCPIEPPSRLTGCQAVNKALAAAPDRWSNLEMLKWNSQAAYHPEYMTSGDVHYTTLGYAMWANFIMQALDTRFPVPEN